MPTDIVMPQMGESIFEGTITKWLKKPGDKVQRDEPLFEISTDKVDAEIPAPASGVLQDIKVAEGATVQVNTVVGTISADGEGAAAKPAAPAAPAKKESAPAKSPTAAAETKAPAPVAPLKQRQCKLRTKKKMITLVLPRWSAKLRERTTSIWRKSWNRAGRTHHQARHHCISGTRSTFRAGRSTNAFCRSCAARKIRQQCPAPAAIPGDLVPCPRCARSSLTA